MRLLLTSRAEASRRELAECRRAHGLRRGAFSAVAWTRALCLSATLAVTGYASLAGQLPTQASGQVIRLDDRLASAAVEMPAGTPAITSVEPLVWQKFYASADLTWQPVHGHIGTRNGDMMLKGDGLPPQIVAPQNVRIDWTNYQAVEIRMSADGGRFVKIKIGDFEAQKPLGPPGEYNVYRFDLSFDDAKRARPLLLTLTDSPDALVGIHSIKLIPKPAAFAKPYGKEEVGKHDEYRQALYVHAPSALTFSETIPPRARLHFGAGIITHDAPVTFRVSVDGTQVYSKTIADPEGWSDAEVDVSRWSGRTSRIRLETAGSRSGALALWANPLLTTESRKSRPNVLIYVIDTLRADHTSLYDGYRRDTTPFLKKLAASGIVFEDCQAQATWTKPSVASLMTSLYSFTHGIRSTSDAIPPGAVTMASEIRRTGYTTASIVATPLVGRDTGLDRGFDYMVESPAVARAYKQQRDRATNSEGLNELLFQWLDQHHDEPFFLYAHQTDPHAPYDPPPPYDAAWGKPPENAIFQRQYQSFRTETEHGGAAVFDRAMCERAGLNPDHFIREEIDRYDGKVLHADHSLETLIEKLKRSGLLDDTLVIVLSDHGEEFWDHGWTGHEQSLYQELAHTVLVMSDPALFVKGRRISEPVQLIDVMPTILELLGIPVPSLAEGQSLAPLLRGRPFKRRSVVMSSRFAPLGTPGPIPENAVDSFAIIDSHWKFIYRNHAAKAGIKKVELYDRLVDAAEQHDLSAKHPDIVEAGIATLNQWLDAQKKVLAIIGHTGTNQMDQRTIEQLRSLGYLGGP